MWRRTQSCHPQARIRAVRCPEWFVERNGYTTRRPADTARITPETGEEARLLAEVLARRHRTLRPQAVVCRGPRDRPNQAFAVGFAYQRDPPSPQGRAATMDTAFARLRVQPWGFPLIMALGDTANCRTAVQPRT